MANYDHMECYDIINYLVEAVGPGEVLESIMAYCSTGQLCNFADWLMSDYEYTTEDVLAWISR